MWERIGILVRETLDAMLGPAAEAALEVTGRSTEIFSSPQDSEVGANEDAFSSRMQRCFHLLGLDVLLDDTSTPWLLEVNSNPSLSLEELRPLKGVFSVGETNQLFAEANQERQLCGPRWGRPCRCAALPRPHAHYQCPVDTAVKLPIVEGVLTVVRRAAEDAAGGISDWSKDTVFTPIGVSESPRDNKTGEL